MRNPGHSESQEGKPELKRGGFTLVEVIIAIIILAVGLMGMAGTTALVVRQITLADVTAERSAALQTTLERLRALPFDSVRAGSDSIGIYSIRWTVTTVRNEWKNVNVITLGPGMNSRNGFPMLSPAVPDTFTYRIIRP